MDRVKKHFEEEARIFDKVIVQLIPYYNRMVDALVSAVPFGKNDSFKVVDLGCGTGTIANILKRKFSKAKVVCFDIAENMIEQAKKNLKDYDDIEYVLGDFSKTGFSMKCDMVLSSLALHHMVTDREKENFYAQIYKNLSKGGGFYNADVVLGSNKVIQKVYMDKWKEFMLNRITEEEVERTYEKYHSEDHPAQLMKQLKWLEGIGFKDVDVIWKHFNFAVYGGVK
jgi:tRNA (cmo5U34)-methyltransferase